MRRRSIIMTANLAVLMLSNLACTQSPGPRVAAAGSLPQPGIGLSIAEVKAQMFHVSAGRRLKPRTWPSGARVAVALSFDIDNASGSLDRGDLGSEPISRGEYGAIDGLPRILRLLYRQNVPLRFTFLR